MSSLFHPLEGSNPALEPHCFSRRIGFCEMVEQAQLPDAIPIIAANLCAMVLSHGKHGRQFGMALIALHEALGLTEIQLKIVAAWAAECDWIWQSANRIELRAAGIYVAKETLDLAR